MPATFDVLGFKKKIVAFAKIWYYKVIKYIKCTPYLVLLRLYAKKAIYCKNYHVLFNKQT